MDLTFRTTDLGDPDAVGLVAAMVAEMRVLYEGLELDDPSMPKAGPAELGPPDGAFVVGYEGDRPVCGGGVKRLPDGACEIKRMYVVPDRRGAGVARQLLDALERAAGALGYDVVRLDTGPLQPGAQHLYRSSGYREIPNFNGNPAATFFAEKRLPAAR